MVRQRLQKSSERSSQPQESAMAPVLTQRRSPSPHAQQDTETQTIQQQQREATVLKIQAKYGTITSQGQERLSFLQAKMADETQRKLNFGDRTHQNISNSSGGNVSVALPERKTAPIQAKLTIGQPGDKYEQEADRVAEQFVKFLHAPTTQQSEPSQPLQRDTIPEALQRKPTLQLQADAGGMTVAPELETDIDQAKSGGQPLAERIKKPAESFLGADLSGVKVHTDANSHRLNRSINARAFTTGGHIFFGKEHNFESEEGMGTAIHELTHYAWHQSGGGNKIQRAVGFEFATNWGVIEKLPDKEFVKRQEGGLKDIIPKHKSKRQPFTKRTLLHQYDGFRMSTDAATTDLKAEIEWVVEPIEEASGIDAVHGIMNSLQNTVARLVGFQGREKFTLDEATDDPVDSRVEVHPNIKGKDNAENMKANSQVTGGVRLDQIAKMFAQLGNSSDGESHRKVRKELMGMGGANILENSATAANKIQGSASLKGLAAQIVAYLRAGEQPDVIKNYIASQESAEREETQAGQAYDYAKLIAKIMARTDFGSQFKLLPQEERQPFEENPQSFADLILGVANVGGGNSHVFERKVKNVPHDRTKGVFEFPVTRRDWLTGIAEGVDRLSSVYMPAWKSKLDSMGAMGNRTESVGSNNVPAPIVEFRQVREAMPYTEWGPFAVRVFEYLQYLNQQQDEG